MINFRHFAKIENNRAIAFLGYLDDGNSVFDNENNFTDITDILKNNNIEIESFLETSIDAKGLYIFNDKVYIFDLFSFDDAIRLAEIREGIVE
jgi:hypothetical protein